MTVRPRYPFVALGVSLVLLLLFAFGPTVILLTGGIVADALGCAMPIDAAAGPCPFMGVDLATFLGVAVAFGYLAFFTFPTGTTLLGVWLLAAVIVTLVCIGGSSPRPLKIPDVMDLKTLADVQTTAWLR
jgi:hypothetical protein